MFRRRRIKVDHQACGNPLECRACLDHCPESVFGTHPRRRRAPGIKAQDWIIDVVFASRCTGCMECVSFCPHQAISIRGR